MDSVDWTDSRDYPNISSVAGIKEGLYDIEALAAYLLYRLNVIDPVSKS